MASEKSEFKEGDIIVRIGSDIRLVVTGIFSDWYTVCSDYPAPTTPWVLKKDARKEYVKVGRKRKL